MKLRLNPCALGLLCSSLFLQAGCSSAPKAPPAPAWVSQPTRTVDNGYIVYVGTGEDSGADRAQLKAESAAVEDLANECSFVPKGTRTEDRYLANTEHGYKAYAKVGIEFQDCEKAKGTVQPDEIRKLANQRLTQQLAQYQEVAFNGEEESEGGATPAEGSSGASGAVAQASGPGSGSSASPAPIGSSAQFFAMRQQLVYQKKTVVLAPPAAYAPGTPQTTQFVSNVTPATSQVQAYEKSNPQTRTWSQSWSGQTERPSVALPAGLKHSSSAFMNPGQSYSRKQNGKPHARNSQGKRRRRRGWNQ